MIKIKTNMADFKKALKAKQDNYIKKVEQAIKEVSGPEKFKEGYDESRLRVQSGRLYHSSKEENTPTTKTLYTDVPYARIQDQGGFAGKNHRAYIKPTNYFDKAKGKLYEAIYKKIQELWKNK